MLAVIAYLGALGALALAAIVWTVVEVARDGYRRQPDRGERPD